MGNVAFTDLYKSYGKTEVIHGINGAVGDGEFVVIVGPSGCGKSTLLRMIAGLETVTAGDIKISGNRVNDLEPAERDIAMVFQTYALYPHMSVFENIASPLRIQKLSETQLRPRVEKVAELLKLTPYMQRKPSELSGGQQQRTALARALVKGADLVLLDEPLVNLDYKLREELREELPRLFADTGATVVYATTEPHEALLMGGYTATMREGRVTQYGPCLLYTSPSPRDS